MPKWREPTWPASAPPTGRMWWSAALDTLPNLTGPFDLVFIDAEKENNAEYLRWAVRDGDGGRARPPGRGHR